MAETGGSIESVTLDGNTYAVASDADVQMKLGGFENDVQANGDGSARQIKTRVPWSLADCQLSIDPATQDFEDLQNLADGQVFFPVTITEASGFIYQGQGQLTGELVKSLQNTVATVSIMGTGELTKQ